DRDGRPWFRTGDVAKIDERGYFEIVGRSSVDIIKSGGFKISAREIEEALLGHPEVREVAIVGVPDAKWGEKIVACVAPVGGIEGAHGGAEGLLAGLIERHNGALADYKKPRGLYLCEALPRNAL